MGIKLEDRMDDAEYRLDRLEALYGKFVIDVNMMLNKLGRGLDKLGKEVDKLKEEMKEFKDEMKDFKDEMKEFKDEMKDFKDEMKMFVGEMKDFKDEMKEYKDWSKENIEWSKNQIREMNKQWGNLANKLGTIVEDIVFPAVRPMLKKFFNCEPDYLSMNIERKKDKLRGEFDVIAICENKVFLFEVKSTPKKEYINELIEDKIPRFKKLFPEFQEKELIIIFASLRIPEEIVKYLTERKIYAMAYREWEYMDILNFDEVKKSQEG